MDQIDGRGQTLDLKIGIFAAVITVYGIGDGCFGVDLNVRGMHKLDKVVAILLGGNSKNDLFKVN